MTEPPLVFCGNCGTLLDEPSDTPVDERAPCEKCGSKTRRFELRLQGRLGRPPSTQTLELPHLPSAEELFPPSLSSATDATDAMLSDAIETLTPIVFSIEFLEPTDEKGSWTAQAFDSEGELISMAEAETWDGALLAIAEDVDPTKHKDGDA